METRGAGTDERSVGIGAKFHASAVGILTLVHVTTHSGLGVQVKPACARALEGSFEVLTVLLATTVVDRAFIHVVARLPVEMEHVTRGARAGVGADGVDAAVRASARLLALVDVVARFSAGAKRETRVTCAHVRTGEVEAALRAAAVDRAGMMGVMTVDAGLVAAGMRRKTLVHIVA